MRTAKRIVDGRAETAGGNGKIGLEMRWVSNGKGGGAWSRRREAGLRRAGEATLKANGGMSHEERQFSLMGSELEEITVLKGRRKKQQHGKNGKYKRVGSSMGKFVRMLQGKRDVNTKTLKRATLGAQNPEGQLATRSQGTVCLEAFSRQQTCIRFESMNPWDQKFKSFLRKIRSETNIFQNVWNNCRTWRVWKPYISSKTGFRLQNRPSWNPCEHRATNH